MMQLLMRENNRGWETINTDPPLYDAVTAEDVLQVANRYFTQDNRAVAIYYRREGDDASNNEDANPLLVGLDDEERQQARHLMATIGQVDAEKLKQLLTQSEMMVDRVPPENQDMAEAVVELVRQRLDELGGGR